MMSYPHPKSDDWQEFHDDYMAGLSCPDPVGKRGIVAVRASKVVVEAPDGRKVFAWDDGGRICKTSALCVDLDAICVRYRKDEPYNPLRFAEEIRCDPRIDVPCENAPHDDPLAAWSLWCDGKGTKGRLVAEQQHLSRRRGTTNAYAWYAFEHDGRVWVSDPIYLSFVSLFPILKSRHWAPETIDVTFPRELGYAYVGFGRDCRQPARALTADTDERVLFASVSNCPLWHMSVPEIRELLRVT